MEQRAHNAKVRGSNPRGRTNERKNVKPKVNFAMLDGKAEGLIFLEFYTGETGERKFWPEGFGKGEPIIKEYPKAILGQGSIHNQKVARELETELLKRFDVVLKELRTEYEDRFEDDDGSNKELCPEEDMPEWPGMMYAHLYYT